MDDLLSGLPHLERTALTLRYETLLTSAEIAERMRISTRRVHRVIMSGMSLLAERLEGRSEPA